MKRLELITYLQSQGCEFVREGSRHSWWQNRVLNKRSAVPRHTEFEAAARATVRKYSKPLARLSRRQSEKFDFDFCENWYGGSAKNIAAHFKSLIIKQIKNRGV